MNVDLPDPDGPMIAVNSPTGKVAVTPSSAVTSVCPVPYTFRSSMACAAGAPAVGARCRGWVPGSGLLTWGLPSGGPPGRAGDPRSSGLVGNARWDGTNGALGFPPDFLRGCPEPRVPVSAAQPVFSRPSGTLRTASGRHIAPRLDMRLHLSVDAASPTRTASGGAQSCASPSAAGSAGSG